MAICPSVLQQHPKFCWHLRSTLISCLIHIVLIVYASSFFFSFWLPCGLWSSQAGDQLQATITTYATAAATPDPLTQCAGLGNQTWVLSLRRHHQSPCATEGTPSLCLFKIKFTVVLVRLQERVELSVVINQPHLTKCLPKHFSFLVCVFCPFFFRPAPAAYGSS